MGTTPSFAAGTGVGDAPAPPLAAGEEAGLAVALPADPPGPDGPALSPAVAVADGLPPGAPDCALPTWAGEAPGRRVAAATPGSTTGAITEVPTTIPIRGATV